MQCIHPHSFQQYNAPYVQQETQSIQISSEKQLVAIKTAQNGKSVGFYFDNQCGVSIQIGDQHVKREDLPPDFKNISSKELLVRYLEHAYVATKGLNNGDEKVIVCQKLLGGTLRRNLNQPGHGITYVLLRRGEDISEVKLSLIDEKENTIIFRVNQNGTKLSYQNTTLDSAQSLGENTPKRIMSRLCLENNILASDQRYWISVDSSNRKVACGFGEMCDITTLHEMQIEKVKLQGINFVKFSGEDSQGRDIGKREDRLTIEGLVSGGALIADNSKLEVHQDEVKVVDLPQPVRSLMEEMVEIEKGIEEQYGEDIWDKIQTSLDEGILREMVEAKKTSIRNSNGPIRENQAYVRIGFGSDSKGGPGHRMVIELWPAGHESPVHQHSSSYSYIKVMKGEVVNTNYPILCNG